MCNTGTTVKRRLSPKPPRNGQMIWAKNQLKEISRKSSDIVKLFESLLTLR